jgi:hypothetical protein
MTQVSFAMKLSKRLRRHFYVFPKRIQTPLLPKFQDAEGQFKAPEFHLARRNLKGDTKKHTKITADAFKIQVATTNAGLLQLILEGTFGLKSNQRKNYLFVPYSLHGENATVYAQLLGKQNDYMQKPPQHIVIWYHGRFDDTRTIIKKSIRGSFKDQPGVY